MNHFRPAFLGLTAASMLALAPGARADKAGMEHVFQMMDSDHDGKISREEHAAGASKMFEMMDADHDGKVTAQEMTAAHRQITGEKAKPGEMSSAEKIKTMDANGDGALNAEEHDTGAAKMFDKIDTNHDGFVSKEEAIAGHQAKMRRKTTK